MQTHQLKRNTPRKRSVQVGRGGTRGKTSGRGTKGQKARSGHKIRPEIRDLIKRLPKLRGRGKNSNLSIQEKPVAVNLAVLESSFQSGDAVTPKILADKNIIRVKSSRYPAVKILSGGDITKKLVISGCTVSKAARERIEKAGGEIRS